MGFNDSRGGGFGGRGGHGGGRGGFGGGRGGGFRRSFGPREMTKITCSECGNEGEVPFKPRPGSAVLCRDCFGKKNGRAPRRDGEGSSEGSNESSDESSE